MRRLISILLAVLLLSTSVFATSTGNETTVMTFDDFWAWSGSNENSAFWTVVAGDSGNWWGADRETLQAYYDTYTNELETDLGTTSITDGQYLRHYFAYNDAPWTFTNTMTQYATVTIAGNTGGSNPQVTGTLMGDPDVYTVQTSLDLKTAQGVKISFPWTETMVRLGYTGSAIGECSFGVTYPSTFAEGKFVAVLSGTEVGPPTVQLKYKNSVLTAKNTPYSIGGQIRTFADYYPKDGTITDITENDISADSRPASIQGDVFMVDENGNYTTYNDYSVFNETNNYYTSPEGEEKAVESWNYDYVERQYFLTCEDGSEVTVKYGDEYIEIVEGDSVGELYYGTPDGGSGGLTGGESGIGDAIGGLFDVLGEIILGIITGIVNLASSALDAVKGLLGLFADFVVVVKEFFGGFTGFLADIFPFLPDETFTILNFGLILMIAAAVFRKFLQ